MKYLLSCLAIVLTSQLFAEDSQMVDAINAKHPRILLTDDRVAELKTLLKTDSDLQTIVTNLTTVGEAIITQPPLKRVLVGTKRFRLLSTSRRVLSRVLVLGTLYRLDPQEKWKTRLIAELKAVCAFEDWYPKHFLDTAEMSTAVAVGYDWLYNDLSKDDRETIRDGLIKHGLEPGLKGGWWVNATNNWNQVCHCGMTLTALALAPDRASDCEKLLTQAKNNFKSGMTAYAPDGVYPEGPGYWNYGTSFSVIMLSAIESVLGDDWGMLDTPGFKQSFDYRMHVQSPTGKVVNYADGGEGTRSSPYHFYLDSKQKTRGYAAFAMTSLSSDFAAIRRKGSKAEVDKKVNRLLALAVAWYSPKSAVVTPALDWYAGAKSKVHVAFMRSAWNDKKALFASLKAGKLQVSHGHLDNGSFIIESDGVRWASDLGSEKEIYDRGDSWSTKQDSFRWKFFRANNFGHNTLTIDGKIQQVAGMSPLISSSIGPVMDLSAAYKGQADSVKRGITMPFRKLIEIRDEIAGVPKGKTVRWNMMTRAEIAISDDGKTATLTRSKQTMTVKLIEPADAKFTVLSAKPEMDIENQNAGWRRLVIDAVSKGEPQVISVTFLPAGTELPKAPAGALDGWKRLEK